MRLDAKQSDRAVGALLGAAAGDALGVHYEFGMRKLEVEPQMLGGGLGGIEPGQWSDDTELACAIALIPGFRSWWAYEAARRDESAGQCLAGRPEGRKCVGTRLVVSLLT